MFFDFFIVFLKHGKNWSCFANCTYIIANRFFIKGVVKQDPIVYFFFFCDEKALLAFISKQINGI